MTRTYSNLATEDVKDLLNVLADRDSIPSSYRESMTQLGLVLGKNILDHIYNSQANVCLACTVEDADFLALGILRQLQENLKSVSLACFWNERFSPFDIEDISIAPILRQYIEPSANDAEYLIVVKSIISGACVVRTNLTQLIQTMRPKKILIVAPVIYHQATEKLKSEFESSVYEKFRFLYFAEDDERTSTGEVIPGIGGIVYDRLGFQGQDGKNRHTPELVKVRRAEFVNVM